VILDSLKQYARIDSPVAVLAVLIVVAAWLWRRPGARGPRRLLVAFAVVYWLMATPIGAQLLVLSVAHGMTSLQSREAANGADTVVVLGGGANTFSQSGAVLGLLTSGSLMRALEAARVYHLIQARLVIVSGGIPSPKRLLKPESEMLRDALISAGVPADHIVQDDAARTTREHPQTLGPILQSHHVGRFVLVTSPTHMRRALTVFRAAGLDPVPSVSLLRSDNLQPAAWVVPTEEFLYISDQAMYEYGAWVYYWWKGWT
jgi:uncharacterized SAM-binding protein YcdF (DUF218 family)